MGSVWSKAYRWEWRKGMTDRWRLSAIIAYGVKMHWSGRSRGCCLRHELRCAARDDDFLISSSCWSGFCCAVFLHRWPGGGNASSRGRWNQSVGAGRLNLVSSSRMHIHTYMGGGGGSLSFAQSFVVPRRGVIDGMQTMCTRLGGDAFVDGGLKRFQTEGILLMCVEQVALRRMQME